VLIAEDEMVSRRYLAGFLKPQFKVKTAKSGREAVTVARNLRPATAVLDIRMPGELDGIEAARQIQRSDPNVSIIFLTAYKSPEYEERAAAAELRVAEWIEKPLVRDNKKLLLDTLRREELRAWIRTAMEEAQARGTALQDFHLEDLEQGLRGLLEEVRDELQARGMLDSPSGERRMDPASTRIDSLYAEIRALVARSATDPTVRGEIDSRMKELRRLQEEEAAELGRRYEASLGFKPGSLLELLERGRKALGDA
jgi:CheY-like chemotaxis protein